MGSQLNESYSLATNDNPSFYYCLVHNSLRDDARMHLAANLDYRIKAIRPEMSLNAVAKWRLGGVFAHQVTRKADGSFSHLRPDEQTECHLGMSELYMRE